MATPESLFQKKVLKQLKQLQECYVFTKEAASLRGIPDLIGSLEGLFFALELKKDLASTKVTTGRIVLQKYNIEKIKDSGGFGRITCPETWADDLEDLIKASKSR